jgi:hypothetical protein
MELQWPVQDGDWTLVMNADGSVDVAATADIGATLPVLAEVWGWLLMGGGVLMAAGVVLVIATVCGPASIPRCSRQPTTGP